jgi:hypothetical protein
MIALTVVIFGSSQANAWTNIGRDLSPSFPVSKDGGHSNNRGGGNDNRRNDRGGDQGKGFKRNKRK